MSADRPGQVKSGRAAGDGPDVGTVGTVGVSIGVVITSFNYRQFIAEAVDSALMQSHAALEVVVVDDGSTDGTVDFLRARYAAEPRLRLIATANCGQLAAFVTGARASRAQVVAFLDADDIWESDYLAKVAAVYDSQPKVDFIYTNMRFFGTRVGLLLPDTQSRDLGLSILLGAYHSRWQASATSAISARRALALQVLDVPEQMQARWPTQADVCLARGADILGAHKFYLGDALVRYRAHGGNAWLNQRSGDAAALKHGLRVQGMLAFYRERAGLHPDSRRENLRYVKHEFRSKRPVRYEELKLYLKLLGQSSLPWAKRIETRLSMWKHYLGHRWRLERPCKPARVDAR